MRPLPRATVPVISSLLLLVALVLLVRAALGVLGADAATRNGYISDDGFYYMTLARNFNALGSWTFDSGVSQTSGFHLLHAYTLAGLHRLLSPDLHTFVTLTVLLGLTLTLGAALGAAFLAIRTRALFAALLVCLFLLSWNVQHNATSAMEWPWVVLLSGAYLAVLQWGRRYTGGAGGLVFMAAVGLLGSLARSDFGLMPAAMVGAALAGRKLGWGAGYLGRALAGLAGAAAGTALVLAHGALVCGSALPSSVRMKLLWASSPLESLNRLAYNLLSLLGPTSTLTVILAGGLAAVILALGLGWLRAPGGGQGEARAGAGRTVWLGCLLTVAGFSALYVRNADVQPWYTANLIIPMGAALCLPMVRPGGWAPLRGLAFALLLALCADQARNTMSYLAAPTWPHHAAMYRAGLHLRQARLQGRVGSWNAGSIGYYQGGEVVNLDGLVNNDIYPYARDNRLPEYIEAKGIRYLVDFVGALAPAMQRRGGFSRPDFLGRLRRVATLHPGSPKWGQMVLLRVGTPIGQ